MAQVSASNKEDDNDNNPLSPVALQRLYDLIKPIKYGSVTLVVQDGYVIQIDRNEKVRLK